LVVIIIISVLALRVERSQFLSQAGALLERDSLLGKKRSWKADLHSSLEIKLTKNGVNLRISQIDPASFLREHHNGSGNQTGYETNLVPPKVVLEEEVVAVSSLPHLLPPQQNGVAAGASSLVALSLSLSPSPALALHYFLWQPRCVPEYLLCP